MTPPTASSCADPENRDACVNHNTSVECSHTHASAAKEAVYAGNPLRFVHACRSSSSPLSHTLSGGAAAAAAETATTPVWVTTSRTPEQHAFDVRMSAAEVGRRAVLREQHRDSILAERRLLRCVTLQQRYTPAPEEVGVMPDAEVYALLRLLRTGAERVGRVLESRLMRGSCSRCEEKPKCAAKSATVFTCRHACLCEACVVWAVMCPLCGASRREAVVGTSPESEHACTIKQTEEEGHTCEEVEEDKEEENRGMTGCHARAEGQMSDRTHEEDGWVDADRDDVTPRDHKETDVHDTHEDGKGGDAEVHGVTDTGDKSEESGVDGSEACACCEQHSYASETDVCEGSSSSCLNKSDESNSSTSTISLTGIIASVAQKPSTGVAEPVSASSWARAC